MVKAEVWFQPGESFLTHQCSFMPALPITFRSTENECHFLSFVIWKSFWWATAQLSICFELKNFEISLSKNGPWHCFTSINTVVATEFWNGLWGRPVSRMETLWKVLFLQSLRNESPLHFVFYFQWKYKDT